MNLRAPLPADILTLKKVLKRKPLLWVGAGMSMAAGYPSANQLIQAMRNDCLRPLPETGNFYEIADAYVLVRLCHVENPTTFFI